MASCYLPLPPLSRSASALNARVTVFSAPCGCWTAVWRPRINERLSVGSRRSGGGEITASFLLLLTLRALPAAPHALCKCIILPLRLVPAGRPAGRPVATASHARPTPLLSRLAACRKTCRMGDGQNSTAALVKAGRERNAGSGRTRLVTSVPCCAACGTAMAWKEHHRRHQYSYLRHIGGAMKLWLHITWARYLYISGVNLGR